ncbi:hypothetical protein [Succinispira mobilis]|uniref:hypothetical protein n=1 Tax=Succinispira mobilis TaxID=78120 RepID=UPI00035F0656|nr:hypothetical protein [Succinispira mobilis]
MNMKKILAGLTLGAVVLGGAVMATSPAFAAEKLGKGFRDGVHCNYADLSQEGKAEMQNYHQRKINLHQEFLQSQVAAGKMTQAEADAKITLMQERFKAMQSGNFQNRMAGAMSEQDRAQHQEFRDKMFALNKEHIKNMVANKSMTQEQADKMLERMATMQAGPKGNQHKGHGPEGMHKGPGGHGMHREECPNN